jgi:hypothetical protein
LLDMIGYNALMGSAWDCVDLASNFLGPIKALKMAPQRQKSAQLDDKSPVAAAC